MIAPGEPGFGLAVVAFGVVFAAVAAVVLEDGDEDPGPRAAAARPGFRLLPCGRSVREDARERPRSRNHRSRRPG